MRVAYTSILVVLGLVSFATSKGIYDPVKSYVTVLNSKNFGSQIDNNRAKGISIVHYYKEGGMYNVIHLRNFYFISYWWNLIIFLSHIDGHSKTLAGGFENFAKENKGMWRMGAVDCDD